MGSLRFSDAERRNRIGVRHRLAAEHRAGDAAGAAEAMVGLHGTDAASVFVAALARMRPGATVADVERALYEDRSLLRLLAMRRTMFVVHREAAPAVLAAASRRVAGQQRKQLLKLLAEGADLDGDLEAFLAAAEEAAMAALEELGEATAAEVAASDPRLAVEIVVGSDTNWESRQKVASRVLPLLSAKGRVIRARPRGGWTSTQFRWAPMGRWCGGPLPEVDAAEAEAELARRWLAAFGPATAEDLRWWTGWTVGVTRRALEAVGAVEVLLEGDVPGVALPDDLEPVGEPEPWAAALPALDPTSMGHKQRGFYLGEHAELVFDRNGNAGPTLWWCGRIVGGWARRKDGEIAYKLLEDVGADAQAVIEAELEALAGRIGDATLAPRARGYSPVERELLA